MTDNILKIISAVASRLFMYGVENYMSVSSSADPSVGIYPARLKIHNVKFDMPCAPCYERRLVRTPHAPIAAVHRGLTFSLTGYFGIYV